MLHASCFMLLPKERPLPPITPPADIDLLALAPLLITAAAAMVALLMELPLQGKSRMPIAVVSLVGVALAGVSAALLWNAGRPPAYSGMVLSDNLAVFVMVVSLGAAFVVLLMAPGFLSRTGMDRGEFYALLLLAVCGMLMLATAGNLIVVF